MRSALAGLLAALTVGSSAAAGECVDASGRDILSDPAAFQREIASKKSCSEASALARACAWGSSMDVSTAGLAYQICDKELSAQKPSSDDVALLKAMEDRCTSRYSREEGTLYLSLNAYCHLSALEWMLHVVAPE